MDGSSLHSTERSNTNGDQNSNVAGRSSSSSASRVATPDLLPYPRDFFALNTGASPRDAAAAALLWQYRKDRPRAGTTEHEAPDGEKMLREIEEMRVSLRNHVMAAYLQSVRDAARTHGMKRSDTGAEPVSEAHFHAILCNMKKTSENAEMVYLVFHQFHRDRNWLSGTVDSWLAENRMKLMPAPKPTVAETEEKTQKTYTSDRGGFGVVGRQAKAQAMGKFMDRMLSKAKWNIQTTKKVKLKAQHKSTRVNRPDGNFFYIVEKIESAANASGATNVVRITTLHVCLLFFPCILNWSNNLSYTYLLPLLCGKQSDGNTSTICDEEGLRDVCQKTLSLCGYDIQHDHYDMLRDNLVSHILTTGIPQRYVGVDSQTQVSAITEPNLMHQSQVRPAPYGTSGGGFDPLDNSSPTTKANLQRIGLTERDSGPSSDLSTNCCAAGDRCGQKNVVIQNPERHVCPFCNKPVHGILCGVVDPLRDAGLHDMVICHLCWDSKKGK